MSMNLNSPVMMLPQPQELNTPQVPDSEMSSTTPSAEYKRKSGPDALAAPYVKKRGTSTGLTIEDKTLEVSSECCENDKDVLQELDSPESDEESDMTDKRPLLPPFFTTGDKVEAVVCFTACPGDFEPLHGALRQSCESGTDSYNKLFERAAEMQRIYERLAKPNLDFLHLQIALHKDGRAYAGAEPFGKI